MSGGKGRGTVDGAAAPAPDPSCPERRRAGNERIAAAATAHRFDDQTAVPLLCECEREGCGELLRLTLPELDDARRRGRYVVAPCHSIPGGRRVHTERGYWIVDTGR